MKPHKGFGLLEILITLVLLGVGVTGLVAMSRGVLGTSQDGRRYEVAMRLAESKLDEFRTFNGVVSAVAPLKAYNSIVNGNSTTTKEEGTYNVSWIVSNQYWNGGWQTAKPTGYLYSYPGRKVINVTVGWSDSAGQARSLLLSGAVSPATSLGGNQMQVGGLDTTREPPKVNYQPGVAPDVISTNLGNGSKQETSKPSPTVTSNNNNSVTGKEVQFETVTYKPIGQGNTQQILQDIKSVSCACSYDNTLSAYLPGEAYSTTTGQLYWKTGFSQSKMTGKLNGSGQPALCDRCCKHHFDGSGTSFTNYYAPLNTTRKRYNSNLTSVDSGDYIDACRFVRLDGYYHPIPDWNLVKVLVTTSDFLAKAANQASYEKYIQYVLKTYIDWQKQTLNWSSNPTAIGPTISEFSTWLATNAATGGDSTTGITINTGTRQLIARGIYVDILNPTYLASIDTSATGYLAKVPFYEINLTMLAEWSMSPLNNVLPGEVEQYGTVTNEAVKTLVDVNNYYFGTYSRGYFTAKVSTKDSNNVLQNVGVKATVYQGNSGITASLVSAVDRNKALSSELLVKIDSTAVSQPMLTVQGKIDCSGKSPNSTAAARCKPNVFNNLNISTVSSGASCRIDKPGTDQQSAMYVCSAPQNNTLVINFSHSGSGNSSFLLNPSQLSIPMTPPASGSEVFDGPCVLLVENGVLNAANLTCQPQP